MARSITINFQNDVLFEAALASFDGATDAEKLVSFKKWLKQDVRDRVAMIHERAAREASNSALRTTIDAINNNLADSA